MFKTKIQICAEAALQVQQIVLAQAQKQACHPFIDCAKPISTLSYLGKQLAVLYDLQRRGINFDETMPAVEQQDDTALDAWQSAQLRKMHRRPSSDELKSIIQEQRTFIENTLGNDVKSTKQTLLKAIIDHETAMGLRAKPVIAKPPLWRPK